MICISLAIESRRMALADMLTAGHHADLLEVRLDKFGKAPKVDDLLHHKRKPVILCCRRRIDGGEWDESEEDRLKLLRQCIVDKADYVEIELDVADQIRPFPPAKRVICYTNLQETPADIADIYAEAQQKKPDVIKLATTARTPEEAWPLLQILAKATVPTVIVGLGAPGIMLTILGRKIGSPWTYAALGKGMETYPGEPTVTELDEVYHYHAIQRSTRLIGVTGFGRRGYLTVTLLNAALAHYDLPVRCLPVSVGSVTLFRKVINAAHLAGVVVDVENQTLLAGLATELDASAKEARAVDVLLPQDRDWHGYNTGTAVTLEALEDVMQPRSGSEKPLQGRMVMIVGSNAAARSLGSGIIQRGGLLTLASRHTKAVQQLAHELNCRHVAFEALYSTAHDVLIVCDDEGLGEGASTSKAPSGIHTGYLRPGMAVVDVTPSAGSSSFLQDAMVRKCAVVEPNHILLRQVAAQFRLLTSKEAPLEVIEQTLNSIVDRDA